MTLRSIPTVLVLATTFLLIQSGCQSAQRKPSAVEGQGVDRFTALQKDYVPKELSVRNKLRELNALVGGYAYNSADVRARLAAKREISNSAQVEQKLSELVQLEATRDQSKKAINQEIQTNPGLVSSLLDPSLFQTDVSQEEFNEERIYPITLVREYRIDSPEDLNREIHITNLHHTFQLEVSNYLPVERGKKPTLEDQTNLAAELNCDQPVRVIRKHMPDLRGKTQQKFTLFNRYTNMSSTRIEFPMKPVQCTLTTGASTLLIKTDAAMESERLIGNIRETCLEDTSGGPDGSKVDTASNFLRAHYQNMSCVYPTDEARLIPDPSEGISNKLMALTGSPLPPEVIKNQDLNYNLDFSNAPKLDAIVVTALEYKNDFYGNMLTRALKYHADHGAHVWVMIPRVGAMLHEKDKVLLSTFDKSNPNIHVEYYVYDKFSLHRFHRVIHTKLLITLSKDHPENNVLITGGRNVKDSFVYPQVPDYSKYPDLVQYQKEEPYAFYFDLEIFIRSRQLARQAFAQVLSLIHRDQKSVLSRPSTIHIPVDQMPVEAVLAAKKRLETGTFVRHMMSTPFVDGQEMEKLFADLFDSAHKEIRIVSPYFRPTKLITDAIARAVDRGVHVDFVTSLSLVGDNVPSITQDVNKSAVNRFRKHVSVYAWQGRPSILHVKAALVDRNLLYLGGVNMSQRSFTHDIENGLLVYSPVIGAQFSELYDTVYIKKSALINEEQKISLLNRLLIPLIKSFF